MLTFRDKYAAPGNYSQNGEQGIIDEVLQRLPATLPKMCIEYGAANGLYCSNTRHLLEAGWQGVMIESDESLYDDLVKNAKTVPGCIIFRNEITPDNINTLPACTVLSIDTDGINDYLCLSELKQRPALIIIEINSSFPPDKLIVTEAAGAAYRPMGRLAVNLGYFILCHTGNLVLVDNKYRDAFPEIEGDGLENAHLYFDRKWIK